jgi:SPP1 family predicted phage head-tail adaptor
MGYQAPRTRIGDRRKRIAIQALATSDDGMGGQAPGPNGWRTIGYAWAREIPLDQRTQESLSADQLTARHASFFDIGYRAGVSPTMRVLCDGQTYEIQTAKDDEGRKRRLILACTEVQP